MEEKALVVKEIWKEVFGEENTNLSDNFFVLGGDSIMALKMMELLRRKGYTVSLTDVFDDPTLEGIINSVVSLKNEYTVSTLSEEKKKTYPATNQQKWFFKNIKNGRDEWCEYVILSPKNKAIVNPHELRDFLFDKKLLRNYKMIRENNSLFFEMSDEKPDIIYLKEILITEEKGRIISQDNISISKGRTCCMAYNDDGDMLIIIHHLFSDAVSIKNIITALDEYNKDMDFSDYLYSEYAWEKYSANFDMNEDMSYLDEDDNIKTESADILASSEKPLHDKMADIANDWGVSVESILISLLKNSWLEIFDSSVIELERIGRDVSGKWGRICGWMSFSRNIDLKDINGEDIKDNSHMIAEILRQSVEDDAETVLNKEKSALSWNYIGNIDKSMNFNNYIIKKFGQFSGKNSGRFSPVYCGVYFKNGFLICDINYDSLKYSEEDIKKFQSDILKQVNDLITNFDADKKQEFNSIYEILGGMH